MALRQLERNDAGTYALILHLPRARRIRVGALGRFRFPRGWYVYVGSALNGLTMRIVRHMRDDKIKFWHIDYLSEYAFVKGLWTHRGAERLECGIARKTLRRAGARIIAPRFGSSDCKCLTHLIYFSTQPRFEVFQIKNRKS